MDSLLGVELRFPIAHLDYGSAFIKANSLKFSCFFLFCPFPFSPFTPKVFLCAEDFISPSPVYCAGRSIRMAGETRPTDGNALGNPSET